VDSEVRSTGVKWLSDILPHSWLLEIIVVPVTIGIFPSFLRNAVEMYRDVLQLRETKLEAEKMEVVIEQLRVSRESAALKTCHILELEGKKEDES
jgi:hypothetical protein